MEIEVTSLFYSDTWSMSGSIATHGKNASPETWAASCTEAAERPILSTEAELQALRDHVEATGFGDDVQSYDAAQCNALMVQLVSLDKREMGLDDCEQGEDAEQWAAIADDMEAGHIPSNMFRTDDGRVFYYLGD